MARRRKEFFCSFCGDEFEFETEVLLHRCVNLIQMETTIERVLVRVLRHYLWPPQQPQRPQPDPAHEAALKRIYEAAVFVARYSGIDAGAIQKYRDEFERAYRLASIRCHPDRADQGGTEELFKQLQEAARVLKELHRL